MGLPFHIYTLLPVQLCFTMIKICSVSGKKKFKNKGKKIKQLCRAEGYALA